jgi:hypothetical protein
MVNTFVPFADIEASAKALDYRRLGKQRVEAWQLWRVLMGKGKKLPDGTDGPPTKGWANHPATLMWKGHTCFLGKYLNAMIDEWVARGYRNTMQKVEHCSNPRPPWWWGWEPVHKSHQASLNRKNSEYYHFEVGEWADWGYVWPSKVTWSENPEPRDVCEPLKTGSVTVKEASPTGQVPKHNHGFRALHP